MAQDLVPQDQVPWRHTFTERKKNTTEAGVCLQPGLLSSKLCQNGSATVAREGGCFFFLPVIRHLVASPVGVALTGKGAPGTSCPAYLTMTS